MAEDTLRVAALQLSSQDDVGKNLEACAEQVRRAHALGATVVVLPENFAYFGAEQGRHAIAETLGDAGPIQGMLRETARALGVTLVAGGMPELSGEPSRPYNTLLVVGPSGETLATYRKIHLFDVDLPDGSKLRESSGTARGDGLAVVPLGAFTLGLSICYDLRFPELYRGLVDRGANVLVVPAAFTRETGKDHWHVLLRARAIEAQSWVVAAAQWGKHPLGRTTYGHAMIVDPWGAVVAEASDRVAPVVADLDIAYLTRVRTQLPSLAHRVLGGS